MAEALAAWLKHRQTEMYLEPIAARKERNARFLEAQGLSRTNTGSATTPKKRRATTKALAATPPRTGARPDKVHRALEEIMGTDSEFKPMQLLAINAVLSSLHIVKSCIEHSVL